MPVIINGTTGISGVDGTAASPAIEGSDTNTGMFFPAADTIAFAEGGVEAMRLDNNGNVGIGTTSPGTRLDVVQAGSTNVNARVRNASGILDLYALSTGDAYIASATAGKYLALGSSDTERFRVGPSGQFGIGGANYGTSGQVLTSGGSGAAPTWSSPSSMVLLGTLTTTSGASQSLSGLNLTGYKQLCLVVQGVSHNDTTAIRFMLVGTSIADDLQVTGAIANTSFFHGNIWIDLANGTFSSVVGGTSAATGTVSTVTGYIGDLPITTASTSVTVAISAGSFDAGSVLVYGVA